MKNDQFFRFNSETKIKRLRKFYIIANEKFPDIYMYMYMSLEVSRINKGCHKFTFTSVRKMYCRSCETLQE